MMPEEVIARLLTARWVQEELREDALKEILLVLRAEREACAKVAEERLAGTCNCDECGGSYAYSIPAAIRERGQESK